MGVSGLTHFKNGLWVASIANLLMYLCLIAGTLNAIFYLVLQPFVVWVYLNECCGETMEQRARKKTATRQQEKDIAGVHPLDVIVYHYGQWCSCCIISVRPDDYVDDACRQCWLTTAVFPASICFIAGQIPFWWIVTHDASLLLHPLIGIILLPVYLGNVIIAVGVLTYSGWFLLRGVDWKELYHGSLDGCGTCCKDCALCCKNCVRCCYFECLPHLCCHTHNAAQAPKVVEVRDPTPVHIPAPPKIPAFEVEDEDLSRSSRSFEVPEQILSAREVQQIQDSIREQEEKARNDSLRRAAELEQILLLQQRQQSEGQVVLPIEPEPA
jgi:hypothetical protein